MTAVLIAIDISSPPPTDVPAALDFCMLARKYFALFLCRMSYTVPAATRMIMTTMKACMTDGAIDADNSAKGLLVNITSPQRRLPLLENILFF